MLTATSKQRNKSYGRFEEENRETFSKRSVKCLMTQNMKLCSTYYRETSKLVETLGKRFLTNTLSTNFVKFSEKVLVQAYDNYSLARLAPSCRTSIYKPLAFMHSACKLRLYESIYIGEGGGSDKFYPSP